MTRRTTDNRSYRRGGGRGFRGFTLIEMPVVRQGQRAAFTLIELLIVMSVIVILFTIALPSVRSLTGSGQEEVAVNTVSAAVSAARSYAAIDPPFGTATQPTSPKLDEDYASRTYVGAAILFTPAGELRLIRNVDKHNGVETLMVNSTTELQPHKNAFEDLNIPYLTLPRYVGAVGLLRGNSGLRMVSPPFAIRFNPSGEMISRNADTNISDPARENAVLYDSNYDSRYEVTKRPSGYNPQEYDPESPDWNSSHRLLTSNGEYKYETGDFEAMEGVIGIYLYNKRDFWDQGYSLADEYTTSSNNFSAAPAQWIAENGTLLMFNRYTGSVVPTP